MLSSLYKATHLYRYTIQGQISIMIRKLGDINFWWITLCLPRTLNLQLFDVQMLLNIFYQLIFAILTFHLVEKFPTQQKLQRSEVREQIWHDKMLLINHNLSHVINTWRDFCYRYSDTIVTQVAYWLNRPPTFTFLRYW